MANVCIICNSSFEPNNKYSAHQKICDKEECKKEQKKRIQSEYYKKNINKFKEWHSKYHWSNRDKILKHKKKYYDDGNDLSYRLRQRYRFLKIQQKGISFVNLETFFILAKDKQNNSCAICKTLFKDLRDIKIDHNHNTGKLRGLLCNSCNNGIGRFKDNKKYLLNAFEYLEVNDE